MKALHDSICPCRRDRLLALVGVRRRRSVAEQLQSRNGSVDIICPCCDRHRMGATLKHAHDGLDFRYACLVGVGRHMLSALPVFFRGPGARARFTSAPGWDVETSANWVYNPAHNCGNLHKAS